MRYGWLALVLACTPPAEQRAAENARAGQAELLDTLTVKVQGGSIVERVEASTGSVHRVRVRAQSLDVRLELSSSGCEPQTVVVEVSHLGDPAALTTTRRSFLDGLSSVVAATREAAGGSVSLAGDLEDPERTPLEPEVPFEVAHADEISTWTVVLDRSRLRVESQPGVAEAAESAPGACVSLESEQAGQLAQAALVVRHRLTRALPDTGYTFGVWGNNGGQTEVRERLLASLAGEDLAFVVVTGDLVGNGKNTALREAADMLDEGLPTPWYATVGDRDVTDSAATGYVEVLGASSFAFDAGQVRIIVLDTADATLEPTQYEALGDWLDDKPLWWPGTPAPPRRLVLTHVPPVAPYGTRRGAFKHRPDGARLIGQLVRNDVDALIASHLAIFEEQRVAGLSVFHSGGAGTPMETVSDDPHHWLRVRVAGDCLPRSDPACADGGCDDCLQIELVPIP